jgi:hypothetical protein
MLKLIKAKKSLLVMALVAILGWAGYSVSNQDVSKVVDTVLTAIPDEAASITTPQAKARATEAFNKSSHISDDRRAHILYGDATGGGHLYGAGKPCKSEFPKNWSEETIVKEVDLIAANDNLNWEQQRNGYYVTEQSVGTVKVRVVKGRNGEDVITAYPTNMKRNPCPANDR